MPDCARTVTELVPRLPEVTKVQVNASKAQAEVKGTGKAVVLELEKQDAQWLVAEVVNP